MTCTYAHVSLYFWKVPEYPENIEEHANTADRAEAETPLTDQEKLVAYEILFLRHIKLVCDHL